MNIAILGYGTVGSGVKEIIDHAVTKSTKQLHVSYILIRKGKAKTLPYMCDDIRTILQDTSVDVIVETMGGLEPAGIEKRQACRYSQQSGNRSLFEGVHRCRKRAQCPHLL